MSEHDPYERYQRQIILKELGKKGQQKIFKSKVLVIGAGGLGCPALQYLAAAGVGCIGILDHDVVELSNLQRQTLYRLEDIGSSKTRAAYKKIRSFNPEVNINIHPVKLDSRNALDILAGYDIIIDGSDNYQTRYLVNDACVILGKPLIYGAVLRFEGQVGVFNLKDPETGIKCNYRDLFPEPPKDSLSCNEVGVLGVLPGIIGTMQATEAIKIMTGMGKPLSNTILSYHALKNEFYTFEITPHPKTPINSPKNLSDLLDFNYDIFCHVPYTEYEISPALFESLRKTEKFRIIDVREPDEKPVITEFKNENIPLQLFETTINETYGDKKMVLFCSVGKRSLKAIQFIKQNYPEWDVYSLAGGINAWNDYKKKKKK